MADILWRNSTTGQAYIWLMNGATIASQAGLTPSPPTWNILGVGDFNGDGKADILWQNATTGQAYIWLMNGTTIASQAASCSVTSDWSIQAVGDFNGDGKSDILWRNSNSGQAYIWLMNGTTIASQASPGSLPPNRAPSAAPAWAMAGPFWASVTSMETARPISCGGSSPPDRSTSG